MNDSGDLDKLLDDLGDLATSSPVSKPRVDLDTTADDDDDDLDDLLGELGDTTTALSPVRKRAVTKVMGTHNEAVTSAHAAREKTVSGNTAPGLKPGEMYKCEPVLLAPTLTPHGLSMGTGQVRACDALRCSSCDFEVTPFVDLEWSPKVDYLFLRNNYPDFDRLEPLLRRRQGARAYACQCASFNAAKCTPLSDVGDIASKWFCAAHQA